MSYPELTEFSQFYRKFGGFFASLRKWLMIIDISSFHHPFFLTLKLTTKSASVIYLSTSIPNFEHVYCTVNKIGVKSGIFYTSLDNECKIGEQRDIASIQRQFFEIILFFPRQVVKMNVNNFNLKIAIRC